MTQTPLTDVQELSELDIANGHGPRPYVPADFARSLERQLSECQALLRRIRSSINTNGELSVLCMQDIDAALAEKGDKGG